MQAPPLRIGRHRSQARPVRRWRRPAVVALPILVASWAAACLAPQPTPSEQPGAAPPPATGAVGGAWPQAPASDPAASVPAAGIGPAVAVPRPALPLVSVPAPAPAPARAALSAERQARARALADALRADLDGAWLKNHRETPLRSGPEEQAAPFTTLPQWTTLRLLESRDRWLLVYFGGDGATRQPGPGWVKAADTGAIGSPPVWIVGTAATPLWSAAGSGATRAFDLPPATRMEVVGPEPFQQARLRVRIPGDGRRVPPAEGWVDGADATRMPAPTAADLPRGYPRVLAADKRLTVPYRTQLDGTPYASANCGPATLGMALESLGLQKSSRALREQVLAAQGSELSDDDVGSFVWALADVARANGARPLGLYQPDGTSYRHWTPADARRELELGRPVILQVRFRALPGREESPYYGDHYIVLTGLLGDQFLYNDSIDSDGVGYDRVIGAGELARAMNASDRPYAFTGFSLTRN